MCFQSVTHLLILDGKPHIWSFDMLQAFVNIDRSLKFRTGLNQSCGSVTNCFYRIQIRFKALDPDPVHTSSD